MKYTAKIKGNRIELDTETGRITGDTYQIKEWIKEDFEAKWNRDLKCWESSKLEETIETLRSYLERVWELKEAEEVEEVEEAEEVLSKELVNGYDGFYQIITYTDGSKRKVFVG